MTNLPETTVLNFFNKVLISLSDLASTEDCSIDSLIKQCKSIASGGQIGDYELILNYCKTCGLIQIRNNLVTISVLGQKFLDANRERYFEINEAQKQLIIEKIIFKGTLNHFARELFEFFSLNQNTYRYEISTNENLLSDSHDRTIHFFKYLGILTSNDFIVQVEKKYSELVYELMADSKGISEQQLEKSLIENRKLGAQAEHAIIEFEKQRLRKLGRFAQAELVKRISAINVSAGYDIESFDGDTDVIFPDRFIEVKATQGTEIRFYWSFNEIRIAKKKKNSYWIYMLREFKENDLKFSPVMINNPARNISKKNYLTMEAQTFLIKEISEVSLSTHDLEELRWYKLN